MNKYHFGKSKIIPIRASDGEHDRWRKAAFGPLNTWARHVLNQAADEALVDRETREQLLQRTLPSYGKDKLKGT